MRRFNAGGTADNVDYSSRDAENCVSGLFLREYAQHKLDRKAKPFEPGNSQSVKVRDTNTLPGISTMCTEASGKRGVL